MEIITGRKQKILYYETQSVLEHDGKSKGVVYDLLVITPEGIYIIEFNNYKQRFVADRLTYYKAINQVYQIKKGGKYALKPVYVVIINTYKEKGRTRPVIRHRMFDENGTDDRMFLEGYININVTVPCSGLLADFAHDIFVTRSEDMIIKEFRNAMRYLKEGKGLKEMCEILRKVIAKETKRLEKTNAKMRKKVKMAEKRLKEKDYLINDMTNQMNLIKQENKNAREDAMDYILKEVGIPESQWNELKSRYTYMSIK